MIKTIIKLAIFVSFGQFAYGQVDNYSKNSKLFDEEEARFKNELKTNMDSAEVYWKHANVTASFTFNAHKGAFKFYEKAIAIDSSKVIYFIDYGRYLFESLGALGKAKLIYENGLRIFPSNGDLKNGLDLVNKAILKNEENKKMSSFGKAPISGHPKAIDYLAATDFENLIKQTENKKSEFFYKKLLKKFNDNDILTDEQVYMLLIGFTNEEAYKPYGQQAEEIYKLNSAGNFKEAIKKAEELLITNPLLPSIYAELIYSNRKIGEYQVAENYQSKLQSILNAMIYTGDGSCEKPYVAFWVPEEYTVLRYLDYKRTGSVTTVTCASQKADKIEVTGMTTREQREIHFNIMLIFKQSMKILQKSKD